MRPYHDQNKNMAGDYEKTLNYTWPKGFFFVHSSLSVL